MSPHDAPLVLVIDGHADTRELYAEYLQASTDFRVLTASDGERGLMMALRHRPTAVTTDLCMPGMGGIEFVRRLKSHPSTRSVAVIAVSGRVLPHADLVGAGFDVTLEKPCLPEHVRTELLRVCGSRARR